MRQSLLVFGIYMVLSGLVFVFPPNSALGLLVWLPTTEPWIRIVGTLLLVGATSTSR